MKIVIIQALKLKFHQYNFVFTKKYSNDLSDFPSIYSL